MTGHPSIDVPSNNPPIYTVSEISGALKRQIERNFDFVRVRGEVSGCKRHGSGHCYFTLRDAESALDGVCWRQTYAGLAVRPQDGLEVIATGRLTTYPGRSKYQMVVEALELAGQGALLKLLEDRKKALAAEGLFDPGRKRRPPFLPEVVGVVTSPTGAVIRDILHRIGDRFPRRVLLWPALVQGPGAAEQVARAIEGFNRLAPGGAVPRPDVLIVARGGGSLEDLWPFNEEIVVRAAAASAIPLISAVGHETDWTLIDFAADVRAPTPTGAAEMAVPVRLALAAQVEQLGGRLAGAQSRMLAEKRTALVAATRGLPRGREVVDAARQRLDDWSERLAGALRLGVAQRWRGFGTIAARLASPAHRIARERDRLASEGRALDSAAAALLREFANRLRHAAALLDSYSYERVLERGFALVRDRKGAALVAAAEARAASSVVIRFHDGEVPASITKPIPPRGEDGGGQGSLL